MTVVLNINASYEVFGIPVPVDVSEEISMFTINISICEEQNEILDCTDETACNYNPEANSDDGSCIYPIETYLDCNGSCLNDLDLDSYCDENDVFPNDNTSGKIQMEMDMVIMVMYFQMIVQNGLILTMMGMVIMVTYFQMIQLNGLILTKME